MVDSAYTARLIAEKWPQEFGEKLRVGDLRSTVGIATLWTQQDIVVEGVDKSCYAVLGNYYDKSNGLEPLVRNCLANPNLRHIIIVGNDKSGSKQVLINFFEKGFLDGRVIDTDCRIPVSIPTEDLELLRANVTVHDATDKVSDMNDPKAYGKAVKAVLATIRDDRAPYAQPKTYEKKVVVATTFPAESSGFVVRGQYVGETWLRILRTVYDYGVVTKMKKNDTSSVRVCNNVVSVITDEDPDSPKMEPYFRFDAKYLKSYYDEICSGKIPEGTIYTYGSRMRAWHGDNGEVIDQIADIIEYLKQDPYRTSALALTWIVEDELTRRIKNKDKNSPCIILVHPLLLDGKLTLTSYIRSNDMFRAWPLNAFGLRALQKIIADGLSLPMGALTLISSSAQIYEDNWQDALDILEKYGTGTNCFFDPRGYYAISLRNGKINAQHFSADGQFLKEYEGATAREITDQINSSQHPVDPYHASYLGEELMKAEIALKLGIEYVQDADLDLKKANGKVCK